jgi:hypothetical protein
MSTTPTPAGLTAVQLTVLEQPTDEAGLDPNLTTVSPGLRPNADPAKVTVVPPLSEPKLGLTLVRLSLAGAAPSQSFPEPKRLSLPATPRSIARPSRNDCSWVAVREGFASRASAAAPATCGDEADVPRKPALQPEAAPLTEDEVASGPAMSGFVLPSIVGPWLLYGSNESFCQQIAPTAITLGDVAGSVTLPAATAYWRPGSVTKSRRGFVFGAHPVDKQNFVIASPKVWLSPVVFV